MRKPIHLVTLVLSAVMGVLLSFQPGYSQQDGTNGCADKKLIVNGLIALENEEHRWTGVTAEGKQLVELFVGKETWTLIVIYPRYVDGKRVGDTACILGAGTLSIIYPTHQENGDEF